MAAVDPCPDEELIAAFVDGTVERADEQALHAHFDACTACRKVLAGLGRELDPGLSATAALPRRADASARVLEGGTRIDRYVVVGVIGSGGMGVVLRAEDPALSRTVALKLVVDPTGTGSGELRARQLAEARALARLSHPNVVEVYDVGIFDGHVWMAMELAEGRTLRAWLRDALPTVEQRLDVLAQLGAGLAAVHAAGLVHRDFKPDNAIVGDDGRVRIVDFGLARDEHAALALTPISGVFAAASEITALTRTGQIMGTPAYMPPEQLRGQPVDALADQFAFCVAAWEALHGQRPFEGRTRAELLVALERGAPRHDRRGDVPRSIDAVLLRGLAPDRTRRFASMPSLLASLDRARRSSRRRWVAAGGVAVTAAALVATTHRAPPDTCETPTTSAWDHRRADVRAAFERSGLSDATTRFERAAAELDRYALALASVAANGCALPASESACVRSRLGDLTALVNVLADADGDALLRADAAVASLRSPEACSQGTEDDPGGPHREALARADALMRLGEYEDALAVVDAVFGEATRSAGPPALAAIELRRGVALRRLGRHDDALRALTASFFSARIEDRRRIGIVAGLEAATLSAYELDDPASGLQWLEHVEAAFASAIAGNANWTASLLDTRGQLLHLRGDHDAALLAVRDAMAAAADDPTADDDDRSTYLSHLATIQLVRGDHADARRTFEQVLRLQEGHFGPDHLNIVQTRIALGAVLQNLGESEAAMVELRRALESGERSLSAEHPALADAWTNLGSVHLGRGEAEDAERAFARAFAITQAAFGHRHPAVARALLNLGEAAWLQADLDRALRLHAEAVDIHAAGGGDPAHHAQALAALGRTQWMAGDVETAAANLRDAASRFEAHDPTNPAARSVQLHLCQIELDRGRVAAARDPCERAAARADKAELSADDRARHARARRWYQLLDASEDLPEEIEVPVVAQPDALDRHVEQALRRLARRSPA